MNVVDDQWVTACYNFFFCAERRDFALAVTGLRLRNQRVSRRCNASTRLSMASSMLIGITLIPQVIARVLEWVFIICSCRLILVSNYVDQGAFFRH